jgi:hypothetical protein
VVAPEEVKKKNAWWYIKLPTQTKLEIFKHDAQSGAVDLSDYGEILFSGWGNYPPKEIEDKIRSMFSS